VFCMIQCIVVERWAVGAVVGAFWRVFPTCLYVLDLSFWFRAPLLLMACAVGSRCNSFFIENQHCQSRQ
jgi:hypothetical protein